MCTVTFIPGAKGGYILTTSRDEKASRPPAAGPIIEKFNGYSLLFPRDLKGGGTWIACDNQNKTVCLFNGAFKAHIPKYPYRKSRGLIVLDFFTFDSILKFSENYDFENIEPFTLIITDGLFLKEFKWDGERTYLLNHDVKKPAIWSSITLYSTEIIKLRESWFRDWINRHPDLSQSDMFDFHLSAGDGNKEYGILMERKELSLRTVSITSIVSSKEKTIMIYLDLLNNLKREKVLLHSSSRIA